MTRVVLDANVYISAVVFGGNPRTVVELAQLSAFPTFISQPMVEEIEDVLRLKFLWGESRILRAASLTWKLAQITHPSIRIKNCRDPDDNRVLECAVTCGADFIVTGDRHLLELHPFRKIAILTATQFLDAAPWLPL